MKRSAIPRRKKDPRKKANVASRVRRKGRATIDRELKKLARQVVMDRDGWTCVMVGLGNRPCAGRLEWMHVDSRRYLTTRYLPANGIAGCSSHHRWAHDYPRRFIQWWRETYPDRESIIDHAADQDSPDPESMKLYLLKCLGSIDGAMKAEEQYIADTAPDWMFPDTTTTEKA